MTRQPTQAHPRDIPRPAVVLMRDGRQYQGPTRIAGGLVHCDDALRRVRDLIGVSYRPVGDRTWSQSEIREIRWLDAELELAA